mmetsp:Transcript_30190/g.92340  ORF Transcript_30190/g.92340 Transcript_30190/m.92340 type:complete len:121 (+) Transcript_30190:82-444(+)
MLRALATRTRLALPVARRCFASEVDGLIPKSLDQQYGPQLQELLDEQKGEITYNRDPIIPPPDQGTKENPILVPSALEERVIGYEDPEVGQLVWFTLVKGPLHYVPDIDLYFKLYDVSHL